METKLSIQLLLRLAGITLAAIMFLPILSGCGNQNENQQESHNNDEHANNDHSKHNNDHVGHDDHANDDHSGHDHGSDGIIPVDNATMESLGIIVAPINITEAHTAFSLPGVVAPVADNMARVGTILPGRIAKLHVNEGSYVSKGTALAEIETVEISKARAEYLEAVARETQARKNVDRQTRLAGEQIGAERTLEAATAEHQQAMALRKEAEAHLHSLGISPKDAGNSFSNRLVIRAPVSGLVAQRLATLGEYIAVDDDMFTIVDTRTVWVNAGATPTQAELLGVGTPAVARTSSGERVNGKVIFVSPTVNSESRTVTVRLQVPNNNGAFRPGAFVTAEIQSANSKKALRISTTGIERDGEQFFVYRQHGNEGFERIEVEAEEGTDGTTIIRSGLKEGDAIAVAGLFYLRSIRMKGSLAEHNHSH